jgi:DNA polymerase-3 subunit epsilon
VHLTPLQRDILCVDAETSGLDPEKHEITELAALRVTPDLQTVREVVDLKVRMLHPERADKEALALNGYDEAVWAEEAVHPRIALVAFSTLLGNDPETAPVWLGSNVCFDWSFATALARGQGLPLGQPRYFLDTYGLAWPLLQSKQIENLSLETLCRRYGVSNDGSHRAMTDVKRVLQVYRRMMGWGPRGAVP